MNILMIFPDLADIEGTGAGTLINTAYDSQALLAKIASYCDHRFGPTSINDDYLIFLAKLMKPIEVDNKLIASDYITLVSDIAAGVDVTVTAEKFSLFDGVIYVSLGSYDQYRALCRKCKGEGCSHCLNQYTVKEAFRQIRKSELNTVNMAIVELDLFERDKFVDAAVAVISEWFYVR